VGIASLVLSIAGLVFAAVGLVPLLGFLEVVALVFGIAGFVFGIIPIAKRLIAPMAIAGFIISIVVIVMAVFRLAIGGWFG